MLALWDHGGSRHPIDRALLLLAAAEPDAPPDELADRPLGVRNAALMRLRQNTFGPEMDAWSDCAACGERMEFPIASGQLPPADQLPDDGLLEVAGHRFARPTSRHLARLTGAGNAADAARMLLRECAAPADTLPEDDSALDALVDEVGRAMDAADPWADVEIAVACPSCSEVSHLEFDVAGYLWEEIASQASRILDDVHALAIAYGWTEPAILALGDRRRAAYLRRIGP